MFMTTDRLFVIMLVILIPMTGCFGAVDNADAEQNDSDTIVNNYYYNNTTTTIMEETEYFTNGGMIDSNTPHGEVTERISGIGFPNDVQDFYPYNFTTNAGEGVKIHYFNGRSSLMIDTECSDSSSFYYNQVGTGQDNFLGGAHANCTHSVVMTITGYNYDTTSPTVDYSNSQYSLIYEIYSMTLV